MTPDEIFWKHARTCHQCDQHPQSVASFHYEPMCQIGRNYAVSMGIFKSYGSPDIGGPIIYVQDSAGWDKETIKLMNEINAGP